MTCEHGDDPAGVVVAAESAEGLEHGEVTLAGAVKSEALAARRRHAATLQRLEEEVDEVVLPTPGSPVTNTICRCPSRASSRQRSRRPSSASRPTGCTDGRRGAARLTAAAANASRWRASVSLSPSDHPDVTAAMKR